MKLIIAIVHARDQQRVTDALLQAGHQFTHIATTGGFLRDGNTTLLIGSRTETVDEVIDIIREHCSTREQFVSQPVLDAMAAGGGAMSPVKVNAGGAVVFVVNVERFERV